MSNAEVICAWCKASLGIKEVEVPEGYEAVTHGICKGCLDELMSQANGVKEQDLDYRD